MPVMRDIYLELGIEDVLRREGIGDQRNPRPKIMDLLKEIMRETESSKLLDPSLAYAFYPIDGFLTDRVKLKGGAAIQGTLIPMLFSKADELGIAVCTIGSGLEEKSANYFKQGKELHGLLLDGIGSAAVDVLCQKVCQILGEEAVSHGYQASSPVNPGMPGLPIAEQEHLFELIPANQIGVSLTSGYMIVPRKSTSLVIGAGTNMPQWTSESVCARCYLKETCRYKIHSTLGHK
jgi:hypothetical protein